jgi:hypothetical protein
VTVVERYTEWYCYFFALAVHELTGWRIVGVIPEGEEYALHFMCLTPDEKFFDIRGFSDEALDGEGNVVDEFTFCTAEDILERFVDDIGHLAQARVDARAALEEQVAADTRDFEENYAESSGLYDPAPVPGTVIIGGRIVSVK